MYKPFIKHLLVPLLILPIVPSLHAETCPANTDNYLTDLGILQLPSVSVGNQNHYQAQLNLLNTKTPFHFKLTDLQSTSAQTSDTRYQTSSQVLNIKSLCIASQNSTQYFNIEMQAIPNSDPVQFLLKNIHDTTGKAIFNWALNTNQGALLLTSRKAFDALASHTNVSSLLGARELKFAITDIDTPHPILYFINSVTTPLHYDFLRNTLKRYQNLDYDTGVAQFIAEGYFREQRQYLVGSVIAYDAYQKTKNTSAQGIYTLEFWPTDPVPERLIIKAYQTISAAMPFITTPLAYHPVGNTQEQDLATFTQDFSKRKIRRISTDSLLANVNSAILNPGEAYGRLKLINPGDPTPKEDSIAIYSYIPNSLGHIGGIITEEPQTPLSHINLKAKQNP